MTPDGELLRRYAEAKSEEAFAELVDRHLGLVYSAALRQVNGDAALAKDVAQTVFTDLARKAASLSRRAVLTGWLYTSTHFAAAKALRTEQRRHAREREAHIMHELLQGSAPDMDWEKLRPALDQVMHELREADRAAILLRYFENRPLAEVAAKIGLSENAARMRVDRAVEKLRSLLSRRGITTTAALSLVLSAHAVHAAPATLAASLTSASLAGDTVATGIALTLFRTITMTKIKFSIIAVVIILLMGTTAFVARPLWNKIPITSQATPPKSPPSADSIVAPPAEAAPSPIAGIWNVEGKPYLELEFDGKGAVSGTAVWYDGPRTGRAPIEIGTFDFETGALKLEGTTAGPDGAMLRYLIEGTLEGDTLTGRYTVGARRGNFSFTK
jgi:RNA polymerase sigma factor (sigma-70 family)